MKRWKFVIFKMLPRGVRKIMMIGRLKMLIACQKMLKLFQCGFFLTQGKMNPLDFRLHDGIIFQVMVWDLFLIRTNIG